jgi:hypothetical protein
MSSIVRFQFYQRTIQIDNCTYRDVRPLSWKRVLRVCNHRYANYKANWSLEQGGQSFEIFRRRHKGREACLTYTPS